MIIEEEPKTIKILQVLSSSHRQQGQSSQEVFHLSAFKKTKKTKLTLWSACELNPRLARPFSRLSSIFPPNSCWISAGKDFLILTRM